MNSNDISIIIPFFDSSDERFNNLICILDSIKSTNISVILCEQHNGKSRLKDYLETNYHNVLYLENISDSKQINKSKLVNLGSKNTKTKYIWQVDADVILKWNDVLKCIESDHEVVKPFNYIVKLKKEETQWYRHNKKLTIKRGETRETVSKFGPLSFIVKKSIYDDENGMNELFEGWSWEDIEFAKRMQRKYTVHTVESSKGVHLWHPESPSNEEHNKKIIDECEKTACINDSKKQTNEKSTNSIKEHIKIKSEHVFTDTTLINGFISLDNKLSVVIPVKIDTVDRLKNIQIVLSYFKENFKDFELIVVEQDASSRLEQIVNSFGFKHVFRRNENCFHKTWNFNYGIALAKNDFILAYDCDVIFKPEAIMTSLRRLVNKETSFIFPYNSYMLEIKKDMFKEKDFISREIINSLPTINHLNKNILNGENIAILYGEMTYDCTGGAFMFSKEEFLKCGGYNPNIISYGCEDNEIEVRVKILGNKIERNSSFNAYHLQHERSTDSHYNNFFDSNLAEFDKIQGMNSDELWSYVNNGFKHVKFDTRMNLEINNDCFNYSIRLSEHRNKYDLTDVDIIIPTYIDTEERFRNITCLLKYIQKFFVNYKIYVVEIQSEKCKNLYHNKNVEYHHVKETYNKTSAINIGIRLSKRKIVCVWDIDAIIKPDGIKDSVDSITNDNYKISYPYNGWFVDIDGDVLNKFTKDINYTKLKDFPSDTIDPGYKIRFSTRYHTSGGGNNGGCVMFDRECLNQCGNYNENFYQWGFEDDEIEARFEILGHTRYNSKKSTCYHMNHSRSDEENGLGTEYWNSNYEEYAKVNKMGKDDLIKYIGCNFINPVDSITVVFNKRVSVKDIQYLISDNRVRDIFVVNNVKKIKCVKYDLDNAKYRDRNIHEFFNGQIVIVNPIKEDIEKVKEIFESNRRAVVIKNKKVYAYRKAHRESIKNGNMSTFDRIDITPEKDKLVSILFTTYGKETLMTYEWMQRFTQWKNSKHEIIAVVHDESVIHRETLKHFNNLGIIDKLIFATKNHGHINGLALATQYAKGKYIAVINNDMLVSEECVEWCLNRMEQNEKTGLIGWHYDDVRCPGTFWSGETLEYNIRPNANPNLTNKESHKLVNASWFSGKLLNALDNNFKRLYLPNGSFIFTRKKLWDDIGGFCFQEQDHYFHDDWYSYGVLEKGFDIENLPKKWGDSSKPEIFLSKTDYVWRGVKDPSKHIDDLGDETESKLIKMICENKKVCILGDKNILKGISFKEVKHIEEKCDVILVFDYVTSFNKIEKYLSTEGIVIFDSNFSNVFEKIPSEYNKQTVGSIGIISKVPDRTNREVKIKQNSSSLFTNIKIQNADRQKFIILTQPRCGFNNMKQVLCKHKDIFLDHDIFQKDRTRISQVLDYNRTTSPSEFLNSYWDLILMSNDKKFCGFRFNVWDEPKSVPYNNISDEFKVILLGRQNIFNSMVDCAYAHSSGVWHTGIDVKEVEPFRIDEEWASGWIDGVASRYNGWKNHFNDNEIPYLEISYENIYRNNLVNDFSEIVDYIGARNFSAPINNVYKKIPFEVIYESIINKDQINELREQYE